MTAKNEVQWDTPKKWFQEWMLWELYGIKYMITRYLTTIYQIDI